MENKHELLPCPFCGAEADTVPSSAAIALPIEQQENDAYFGVTITWDEIRLQMLEKIIIAELSNYDLKEDAHRKSLVRNAIATVNELINQLQQQSDEK